MQLRALRCMVLLSSLTIACGKGQADAKRDAPNKASDAEMNGEQVPTEFDPIATAKQIVTWLEAGENAKVRELFDEAMNEAIPSDLLLGATWTAIETQFGAFVEQRGTSYTEQGEHVIVVVTCSFERSAMDVRVVFDDVNRLAGLQITPASDPGAFADRPQTPQPPFPYAEKQVQYSNTAAGIEIGGTLTLPSGAGPHPAVLLITGSGQQDRDETLHGHKPFAVIADHLTRKGIAVLRVDDRGVGKTGGDPATSTVHDHASDVEAGVAFLAKQPEIDRQRIGLIGHSEGGVIATMVAARSKEVAFVVSLAGPGVSGAALNPMQVRALLEAQGASAKIVEEIVAGQTKLMALLVADAPEQELREAVKQLAIAAAKLQGAEADELDTQKAVAREMLPLLSPWFRSWAKLEPSEHLAKLSVPILVMIGDKDLQVPADPNLEAIRAAAAGNPKLRTEKLTGLNHLFQTAKSGSMDEYATISETFSPAALELMTQWLRETAKLGS